MQQKFAQHFPLVADMQLKHAKSRIDVELEEIMATQPCAPALPQKFAEYLLERVPRSSNRLPHLLAIGKRFTMFHELRFEI